MTNTITREDIRDHLVYLANQMAGRELPNVPTRPALTRGLEAVAEEAHHIADHLRESLDPSRERPHYDRHRIPNLDAACTMDGCHRLKVRERTPEAVATLPTGERIIRWGDGSVTFDVGGALRDLTSEEWLRVQRILWRSGDEPVVPHP